MRLEPGEVYSELVDLRDTCNLRVPDALGAGPVTVHYGFREARRASHQRSVVIDETPEVFPDVSLVTTVTPPAPPPAPAPEEAGWGSRCRAPTPPAARGWS
ncbi:MAG: hypothetical protein R3A52_30235 [Polyangiales bacterium]